GPFGFGWSVGIPQISRRTDKGLPRYDESDVFVLSGSEDLVPQWIGNQPDIVVRGDYAVERYRPRIDNLFARIERWTERSTGLSHWRSITRDNVTSFYGQSSGARITDPADPTRIFTWLLESTVDDVGNAVFYEYKPETYDRVDR